MRIARRLIYYYWFPLTLGMLITTILVWVMLPVRGYFTFGGEFMITPALTMAHMMLRDHFKRKRRQERALRRNPSRA